MNIYHCCWSYVHQLSDSELGHHLVDTLHKNLDFSSGSLEFPIKNCQNPQASQHVLGKALLGKLLILSPWLPIAEYPVIKHGNWKIHYLVR